MSDPINDFFRLLVVAPVQTNIVMLYMTDYFHLSLYMDLNFLADLLAVLKKRTGIFMIQSVFAFWIRQMRALS